MFIHFLWLFLVWACEGMLELRNFRQTKAAARKNEQMEREKQKDLKETRSPMTKDTAQHVSGLPRSCQSLCITKVR